MDKAYFGKFQNLIGVDEVGRGPLAGPVVACGVLLNKSNIHILKILKAFNITDSKKLSEKKRKEILEKLKIRIEKVRENRKYTIEFESGECEFFLKEKSSKIIDEINILQASLAAMKDCCDALSQQDTHILIDGNKVFEVKSCEAIVKGDSKSLLIGLASIIAKVYRDELMKKLSLKYPGYGLERHAGYPTKAHYEALERLGASPIHRLSFKGVI